MTWKIPLFKIYWDETDIKTVNDAIKKRYVLGNRP